MKRLILCVLLIAALLPGLAASAFAQEAKYVAIVVIDSMRPDYMTIAETPNLKKLIELGTYYDNAWVGGVVNNTPPSHATISTGCFTRTHGVVAFTWKDPVTGMEFNPTKLKPIENGDIGKIISEHKAPSIGKLVKQKYPDAKIASVGAHKFYAVGSLAGDSSDYTVFLGGQLKNVELGLEGSPNDTGEGDFVKGQIPPKETVQKLRQLKARGDAWGMDAAITVLQDLKPTVLMINLPSVDGTGHACGGIISPDVMKPVIEEADKQVGKLMEAYKKLGLYEQTVFFVVGDHGMMVDETPAQMAVVDAAISKAEGKLVTSTGAGPVWISDSAKSKEVADTIAASKMRSISGVYYKEKAGDIYVYKAAANGAPADATLAESYDYLLSTVACANGPDIFVCTREMSKLPPDFKKKGRHYQIAWGAQHIAFIMAGPGVKSAFGCNSAARLVDVAPTALSLLGVRPRGMDGIVLANALTAPTARQTARQKAVDDKLIPLRDALRDQPKYDPTAKTE